MPQPTTLTRPRSFTALSEREEAAIIELVRPLVRSGNDGVRRMAGQIVARDVTFDTVEDALYWLFMFRFANREADDEIAYLNDRSVYGHDFLLSIARAAGATAMRTMSCTECGTQLGGVALCSYCERHRQHNRGQ